MFVVTVLVVVAELILACWFSALISTSEPDRRPEEEVTPMVATSDAASPKALVRV